MGGTTAYGQSKGISETAPWGPQAGRIQNGFRGADDAYAAQPGIARMQTGADMMANTAQSSTLPQTSADFLTKTLTDPNPNAYIDELSTSIGNKVVPGVMSQFALSGRAGDSPLAQGAVAEGISTALAPYMFGSAENQMNRQMDALALSPSIEAARYGPANAMYGAGQAEQNAGWSNTERYMNTVGQPYGSVTRSNSSFPIEHTSTADKIGTGLRWWGK